MYTATDPHSLPFAPRTLAQGCTVTIGNFDGMHYGHQSLIRHTVAKARADALPAVLISFEPHPLQVLLRENAPARLMSLAYKLECFAGMGVDLALIMPFTQETAALSPEEFVRQILVHCLNTRTLVVGYDYAFGKNRRGNAALLRSLGRTHGYTLEQIPPVSLHGEIVSSTRIRDTLLQGDVEDARALLGRPYSVEGTVEHGMKRGGELLGFPTANLCMQEPLLLPKTGVYAVMAEIRQPNPPSDAGASGRLCLQGVANVGKNPTFADAFVHVETHIFDFHEDIYGSSFRTHFVKRLRDELQFNSVNGLIEQIHKDCSVAKEFFRVHPDVVSHGNYR
ncbi:MAG: bifunctional riboflavin kinase/FAD synthetase [Desulfovibrio sp.]|jgi:riboflavin kinase/FMN adenylyltransferase|nr:bifunctional riboflavin kinase/FAD synthetase [Desulfovibrio sp.]